MRAEKEESHPLVQFTAAVDERFQTFSSAWNGSINSHS